MQYDLEIVNNNFWDENYKSENNCIYFRFKTLNDISVCMDLDIFEQLHNQITSINFFDIISKIEPKKINDAKKY